MGIKICSKRYKAVGITRLGMWLLARTVPGKVGSKVTPGDGRRDGLRLAMTPIVSGLVRELVCVESRVLVSNRLPQTRRIHTKKAHSHSARISPVQQPGQQRGRRRGMICSH